VVRAYGEVEGVPSLTPGTASGGAEPTPRWARQQG
jgi:hypothetical protein